MSETARRVVKNSVLRVGGYAIGATLFFFIIVLVARYLGAEKFGYFSFILAFVGVFQLVADMGIRNILIRDIAVDRTGFKHHLGIARTLLWLLSIVSLGLIVGVASLLDLREDVLQSIYIAGLAVIVTFHGLGYSAVFRAFEEMEWDILGSLLHKVVFISLVWVAIQWDRGLQGVFTAMLLANASQWLYAWTLVGIRYGRARLSRDLPAVWGMLARAFPLGIAEILRRLTQHVDKLLLLALSTSVSVGIFSVAYRFLEAMNIFIQSMTIALFPAFSRFAQVSADKLFQAYAQSLKFLYAIGIPLAVMVFVFADHMVDIFFGESFRGAGMVLMILAPAMIFLFPISAYGYVFTALGRQRIYTGCVAVSLGVNIVLDLWLIPLYGYTGAAIGTLFAEVTLFFTGVVMMRRLGSTSTNLHILWRPLLAGLLLGALCWAVRDAALHVVILGVLTGAAGYIGVLLLLRTFTRQEIALVLEAVRLKRGGVVQ